MFERDRTWGVEETRLVEIYGDPAEGLIHHAFYNLGYMGYREGAPFVFSYTLQVLFRDGRVTHVYVDD